VDPVRTLPAITAFLALIRACSVDATTTTVLCRSLREWAPHYHSLRITYTAPCPPCGARSGCPSRVAQTMLTVAHTILGGLAGTVRCWFGLPWTPGEVSHRHLTLTFPHLCVMYQLAGEPHIVYARMHDLDTRLQSYDPGRRWASRAAPRSAATLDDLVTRLDQYIPMMLLFCTRNFPHSILGAGHPCAAPPLGLDPCGTRGVARRGATQDGFDDLP
jgi:hypothetical protein